MGGFGSGRWGWHRAKVVVEDCRTLDLGLIVRGEGPAPGQAGTLTWSRRDEVTASVGYEVVSTAGGGLVARMLYTWTPRFPPGADPKPVSLDVRLELGSVPRGGRRWWGRCPLAGNDVPCGRRVGKLYLPPGSMYFGCRHCHRLSYRSRQEHDKRVTQLLRDPDALPRLSTNLSRCSAADLVLVLKALAVQQARDERWFRRFEKKHRQCDK